jgi:hypothetical protein
VTPTREDPEPISISVSAAAAAAAATIASAVAPGVPMRVRAAAASTLRDASIRTFKYCNSVCSSARTRRKERPRRRGSSCTPNAKLRV